MTEVRGSIKIEIIPGDCRYVRIIEGRDPWAFYSDELGCWNEPPVGFVFDLESVPLLRGTNPEAGAGHDLVCRKNFLANGKPISKTQAARVYLELQRHYDHQEGGNVFNRIWDWFRRGFKTSVVWVAPCYWQKFNIEATYEEITGSCETLVRKTA